MFASGKCSKHWTGMKIITNDKLKLRFLQPEHLNLKKLAPFQLQVCCFAQQGDNTSIKRETVEKNQHKIQNGFN